MWLNSGKIILNARFWTRSNRSAKYNGNALCQTGQQYSSTERISVKCISIKSSTGTPFRRKIRMMYKRLDAFVTIELI